MQLWVRVSAVGLLLTLMAGRASSASKPHVVAFGKWTTIKLLSGPAEEKTIEAKVRPLYVDGKLKEFTFGTPHDVTDRLLVVRRIVRVNDALPQETASPPRWSWQLSGWLVIDRGNGHISQASLPQFDPDSSPATWYRDYVAYCGVSDDGRKLLALVMQLGRRKPVLRKQLAESDDAAASDLACPAPVWQRQPTRVTFVSKMDQKTTYAIRGHAVEMANDDESEDGTE